MQKEWFYLRNLSVDDVPVFLSLAQRDHISQKLPSLLNLTQNYERKAVLDDAFGRKLFQPDPCTLLKCVSLLRVWVVTSARSRGYVFLLTC